MHEDRSQQAEAERRRLTHVSLATNLDTRYWMQTLRVSRAQLEEAVSAIGAEVEGVRRYLKLPERRNELP